MRRGEDGGSQFGGRRRGWGARLILRMGPMECDQQGWLGKVGEGGRASAT